MYLEAVKPVMRADGADKEEAQQVLLCCLESGLRLLHPIMPFITEELYHKLPDYPHKQVSITIEPYPERLFPGVERQVL